MPTWDPQFGEIAGHSLESWLDSLPPAPPVRRSIILATDERTGSEWLCQLMAATGVLGRPAEYFNPWWFKEFIADYPTDATQQVAVALRAGTGPNGVFSLKLHPWAFDALSREVRLAKVFPQPLFVRLSRHDMLAQAISLVRARQTRQYHAHWTRRSEPVYDADAIEKTIEQLSVNVARWERYFARNGIRPLRTNYEAFAANPDALLRRMAQAVGETLPEVLPVPSRPLAIQRDDLTVEWRQRFVKDRGDRNVLDGYKPPQPKGNAALKALV